jgi:hypothetical protein
MLCYTVLCCAIEAAGGYYFSLAPLADGEGLALYTPAGWFHWLAGDSGERGWHCVFGGSFFPRGGAEAASAKAADVPAARAACDAMVATDEEACAQVLSEQVELQP